MSFSGHTARKRFGQHWLKDGSVLDRIVAAAELSPSDCVLEVGPGRGALTGRLLGTAVAQVHAVELDRDLVAGLQERFGGDPRFSLQSGDVLDLPVLGDPSRPANKVVANIPYNITTDILKQLLPMGDTFRDMVFMFQEEVARRLIRQDSGASDYRPMSVRVHYYSEPYYIRPVTASCFDPPPNVESCLVGFRPKPRRELPALRGTEKQFFSFVQACFAQKRKMLKNNLRAVCDDEVIAAALEDLGRDEKTRAQQLTMDEYVRLFNFVRMKGAGQRESNESNRIESANPKESKSVRERRARVERATSRLVAQAVSRDVLDEDDDDDEGIIEV